MVTSLGPLSSRVPTCQNPYSQTYEHRRYPEHTLTPKELEPSVVDPHHPQARLLEHHEILAQVLTESHICLCEGATEQAGELYTSLPFHHGHHALLTEDGQSSYLEASRKSRVLRGFRTEIG